eukprot:1283891-Rhodomonas_salina.2
MGGSGALFASHAPLAPSTPSLVPPPLSLLLLLLLLLLVLLRQLACSREGPVDARASPLARPLPSNLNTRPASPSGPGPRATGTGPGNRT